MITAVRPGSAIAGMKHSLTIELNPENAARVAVPVGQPDWVQIGPFEALSIEREGNLVRIEIEIPQDAAVGVLMDCHIEFKTPNRPRSVFKSNEVFRVVEQESP